MKQDFKYIGKELEISELAVNWKKYFSQQFRGYIKGNVLEAGAGIGGTTGMLYANGNQISTWTCLEPDEALIGFIDTKIKEGSLPKNCTTKNGFIDSFDVSIQFDTIIYIDVLEHIEVDRAEVERAMQYLKKGGNLIILVPAFQSLFNEFDEQIGHYRRYNKALLKSIIPDTLSNKKIKYLDSLGFFTSLANKLFLHQYYPTAGQVRFWDTFLVPISRITDYLLSPFFGKSLIGIWTKE